MGDIIFDALTDIRPGAMIEERGDDMTKRTILSLGEEILEQADRLAAELKISRAELIRRSITFYAEEMRRQKEQEGILREREAAFKETERIRRELGKTKDPNWNPVKVIREWRDKEHSGFLYERREIQAMSVKEKRRK